MGKYDIEQDEYTDQRHKRAVYKFPRRAIIANFPNEIWSVDLVDYHTNPSGQFKYILNAVDVFSRKLMYKLLKSKSEEAIESAMTSLFEKQKPKKIWMDQEAAFKGKWMKQLLKENGIELYHTYGPAKSAVVESLQKTEKQVLEKSSGTWSSNVGKFEKKYNDTEHSTTTQKPNLAFKNPEAEDVARQFNNLHFWEKKKDPKTIFNVGDEVRLQKKKYMFEKGYKPRWTSEICVIHQINNTNPITYTVKSKKGEVIEGSFYQQELQKINKIKSPDFSFLMKGNCGSY